MPISKKAHYTKLLRSHGLSIFSYKKGAQVLLPLLLGHVQAGFPSPADDYVDTKLDLNDLLITHPSATFFMRVEGDSMIDAGINSGDIIIVNRALKPRNNQIIIAFVNGELTVKRIRKERDALWLISENTLFKPMCITTEMDFEIWGIVTYIIHQAR